MHRCVAASLGDEIQHLIYDGVRHLLHQRIDLRAGDDLVLGKRAELLDLRDHAVHESACDHNQVLRVRHGDAFADRAEAHRHPLDERGAVLSPKDQNAAQILQRLGCLEPPVKRKGGVHHKHQRTVVRKILKKRDKALGILLGELVRVIAAHLQKCALRQKRHGVYRVRQLVQLQSGAIEPMIAEIVFPAGEALLFQLRQELLAQVLLLAAEHIEPLRPRFSQTANFIAVVRAGIFFLLLCHRSFTPSAG